MMTHVIVLFNQPFYCEPYADDWQTEGYGVWYLPENLRNYRGKPVTNKRIIALATTELNKLIREMGGPYDQSF